MSSPVGTEWFRRGLQQGPFPITCVRTHGKFMWWEFRDQRGQWNMWCTYGMTGQWVVQPHEEKKPKHMAFGFNLVYLGGRQAQAFFVDTRRFGTIKFVNDVTETATKLRTLGPDMLVNPIDGEHFHRRLQLKKFAARQVGVALLDQSLVAGVGNYIRAEALYLARLSPFRAAGELSAEEATRLRDAIVKVMADSYACGGATLATFKAPDGHSGLYKDQLRVYGKECDPEGRSVVSGETADGRTIWWVPEAQQ